MTKPPLIIQGMHGLGDNLHQRAIVRQLIPRFEIWLESSWVSVYHDFIGQGLHVIHKKTTLRTQTKNAQREHESFSRAPIPLRASITKVWYHPRDVKGLGSVLAAMMKTIPGCNYATADFRLPIPAPWALKAVKLLQHLKPTKPIMIYRPLVDRHEWQGNRARNPDPKAYAELFHSIRNDFFVISIADLVRDKEWMVGTLVKADAYFHEGELEFETLAALFVLAKLVFCSSGFATVLAQSVGTPVVSIFGTYERPYSFSAGARYSQYLGIEPINPRDDFQHNVYDKTIAIPQAIIKLREFVDATSS